ncbi:Protoporphyrinogen oxidase [Candidatus Zixiibacteriota bacterium]|nr:Protoporphyrinogen oxidase [candidate division Zixibacteria bacterium]
MKGKAKIAIVGAGISGLSAGFFIRKLVGDRAAITIFERENRLGGTIGTSRENGYLADWGPNGFLDREPLTLEFVNDIELHDKLYPSNQKSEKRFIYRGKRLHEISANPMKFLASGLLSMRGKLRIGMEIFVPRKKNDDDESIFRFVERRIGREAAEILIDPMVSGIYGGDAEKLSLGACFPVMENMEKEYGGLIKAMFKKARENRKSGKKGGPAGPSGHLTSFRGGLFTLIERLENILGTSIHREEKVVSISKGNGNYRLNTSAGSYDFDHIIIATQSFVAGSILMELDRETAGLLGKIPYSNLAVCCQGYRLEDISRPVDGFGFLVPHNQNLYILGSIWTSVIFPEQAPEGFVLFRTMLGGAKDNKIIDRGEKALGELAHNQLATIMGIKKPPSFQKIIIWKEAIPQYTLGHRERLQRIEANLAKLGSLYLAGNAYTGIGLNDAIKRSFYIAETIAAVQTGNSSGN